MSIPTKCEVCESTALASTSRRELSNGVVVVRLKCGLCEFTETIYAIGIRRLTDEELATFGIIPRYDVILTTADTNAIRRQWERILNQKLTRTARDEIIALTQLFVRAGILETE